MSQDGRNKWSVAPHVGAWIETLLYYLVVLNCYVAPHVGAWIETREAINMIA